MNCCIRLLLCLSLAVSLATAAESKKKTKPVEPSPLDRYIQEAMGRAGNPVPQGSTAGSIWSSSSRLADLGSDVRARLVDDMVTIQVVEQASAVSTGAVKTSRQSNVTSSITAGGGITRATGPLANLAKASTATALDGQGSTSRGTTISTTLAARVTHVLPNGYLVVEGNKEVLVNTEKQLITVRGMVRPADISPGDVVRSDNIAQLELRVNGKGVVGDSIRRPNILYRILLGLLPF